MTVVGSGEDFFSSYEGIVIIGKGGMSLFYKSLIFNI